MVSFHFATEEKKSISPKMFSVNFGQVNLLADFLKQGLRFKSIGVEMMRRKPGVFHQSNNFRKELEKQV